MSFIHLKGVREHNLKNVDLAIPRNQLVVITGVSGSGKSSLAFNTLYAAAHRQYVESLSIKARQTLAQLPRPDVDSIEGLSPAIAIEQQPSARDAHPRSTIATVTDIADYAALLWALCAEPHCPEDGGKIERRSLDESIDCVLAQSEGSRILLLAPLLNGKPDEIQKSVPHLRQRGFQRIRIQGQIHDLSAPDPIALPNQKDVTCELVIDRLIVKPDQRSRIADSLELAFQEGKDQALALVQSQRNGPWREIRLSRHLACSCCGTVYEPLTSRHFSFDSPKGACPECGGLGHTFQFQETLVVPNPHLSIKAGAIKPWRIGSKSMIIRRNAILRQLAEQWPFDPHKPWKELDAPIKKGLLYGIKDRCFHFRLGRGKAESRPFDGVLTDLEATFQTTSSDALRVRLITYQTHSCCPSCKGQRLNAYSRAAQLEGKGLGDMMQLSVTEALGFMHGLSLPSRFPKIAGAFSGLERRLAFLEQLGLGYLTLDRAYATLSSGEAQRVRLATQLGLGLTGVIYVLDEPSIGLHPSDHCKLIQALQRLRDRGNSIVVVEHDPETLRCADHLIELGPRAGTEGGKVLFQGDVSACLQATASRTGPYLSGRQQIEKRAASLTSASQWLTVYGAAEHNLKHIDIAFPIGLLTVVCGVSGSGKSTLVNEILARTAALQLNRTKRIPGRHRCIQGLDPFDRLVEVDATPIGWHPRSTPATYVKLFDLLRSLFAQCPLSKQRGYTPTRFSFNTVGGRCEQCQGDGQIRLNLQFLADAYSDCPSCQGKRYNRQTLDVRFKGRTIADVLDMTVSEALVLFREQPRICKKLQPLEAVGLGYLKLGQPSYTLSGGEAQRIKIAFEVSKAQQSNTLYILDEPTKGLHWIDIQKLMCLLFTLREAGNTIILIEHHLDVIHLADYLIELGPKGGQAGGHLLFSGPRNAFHNATARSPTAQSLDASRPREKKELICQ